VISGVSSLFSGNEKVDRVQSSVCSAEGSTTNRAKRVPKTTFGIVESIARAVDPISVATRAEVMTTDECDVRNDVRLLQKCGFSCPLLAL